MSKVIVAGSINMDVFALAEHFPKMGETVQAQSIHFAPGGKGGNEAVAAARLGAETFLVGKIGDDFFGKEILSFFREQKINLKYLQVTDKAQTGTALITVAEDNNTVVIFPSANHLLTPQDLKEVVIKKGDILTAQFEIPEQTILKFFEKGKTEEAVTLLNPSPAKKFNNRIFQLADYLVINEIELAYFLGQKEIKDISFENIAKLAEKLKFRKDQTIIVTLGKEGAVAVGGETIFIKGKKVTVVDTTGAGDCFLGALASKLSKGEDLKKALEFANTAASLKVQRLGASNMPWLKEI